MRIYYVFLELMIDYPLIFFQFSYLKYLSIFHIQCFTLLKIIILGLIEDSINSVLTKKLLIEKFLKENSNNSN